LNSVLLFSHFVQEASIAAAAMKNAIFFIVVKSIRFHKDVNIYANFDKACALSADNWAFRASRLSKVITSRSR